MMELKKERIEIVIPIKNEMNNLYTFMSRYKNTVNFIESHIGDIRVSFVDDSDKYEEGFLESILAFQPFEYRFLKGVGDYGGSLTWGMLRGGEYDKLIIMDIDHPINRIINMINMLDRYDVVIGYDMNQGITRKVTNWLCNTILGLNLNHPTCGFIGFNSYVTRLIDERNINFKHASSKRDIVHVEWINAVKTKGLKIGEVKFNTLGTDITHNYSVKRSIRWLWDFFLLWLKDCIGTYP